MIRAHMVNGQVIEINYDVYLDYTNDPGKLWIESDQHFFQAKYVVDFESIVQDDAGKIVKSPTPQEFKSFKERQEVKQVQDTKGILDEARSELS